MSRSKRQAVIVLGMHRSGTSALDGIFGRGGLGARGNENADGSNFQTGG
jgi:hypothetical protein